MAYQPHQSIPPFYPPNGYLPNMTQRTVIYPKYIQYDPYQNIIHLHYYPTTNSTDVIYSHQHMYTNQIQPNR
ncbi:hypothetical protein [Litchfieldia salsa]|uniref:Uncharacterized protein n=1 Tax=Litchfieldia salsa TaxID=930152 RepID=A0A1H0U8L3_9BACI|nr:hypothetical protein [Litchfieldia salsa]SDP62533.1 hypothetical protein SAMN05216565_104229 [Litchfieldia salsa]